MKSTLMNDPWIERISRACGYLAHVERGQVSLATQTLLDRVPLAKEKQMA